MGTKGEVHRHLPLPEQRFLTYRQVAALLGYVSRQGVWKAVKRGDLPAPVKVGGMVRFDAQELMARIRGENGA